MRKEENTQRIIDNHGNITNGGDIFDFKGAKINIKPNLLFKKYHAKNLTYQQWMFLFNFRSIFYILTIGLFLLPLFSVNKHNISFYEFAGMIIVFICLCSCYWNKIKKRRKSYE